MPIRATLSRSCIPGKYGPLMCSPPLSAFGTARGRVWTAGLAPANHSASSSKVSGSSLIAASIMASSSGVRGLSPGLSLGILSPFLAACLSQTNYTPYLTAISEAHHVEPFTQISNCNPSRLLKTIGSSLYCRAPLEVLQFGEINLMLLKIHTVLFYVPFVYHVTQHQ